MKKAILIFVVILFSVSIAFSEKLEIEIWVMSQCPYCVQFENNLFTALRALDIKDYSVKYRYLTRKNDDGTLTALHGEAELAENLRRIAIARDNPEQVLHSYIALRNMHYTDSLWQKDAVICGLDTVLLRQKTAVFETIQRGIIDAKEAASKDISSSPTVFINGDLVEGLPDDAASLSLVLKGIAKRKLVQMPDNISKLPECMDDSDCLPESGAERMCKKSRCVYK